MTNKQIIGLAMVIAAVLVISNALYIVDQREKAILLQFGQIREANIGPGLHVKFPFVQTVKRFDGRVLTIDNQTENFLTVEKKNVEVDFFIKWKIADTRSYYLSTGGQEVSAGDTVAAIINRGLRNEFGSRTVKQVVSGERDEILSALEGALLRNVADLGIEIVDVRIKRVDLPRNVSDSVYQRMNTERKRVASELRARGEEEAEKIRAEADRAATILMADAYREAETLRGEGDAEAASIYAQAYGKDPEFYSFYRSLDIYRRAFSKSGDVLVLNPDSELFKYFEDGASAR